MDLETRKYQFIEELSRIDDESIIDTLERVLKREKEAHQKLSIEHIQELDIRLKSYQKDPEDLLDWKDVQENW